MGLDETGLISKACKAAMSPISAKVTSWASLARNRAWVGLEKSGAGGSAPDWAQLIPALAGQPVVPVTPSTSKRKAILDCAQSGALPPAPDFSKPTHARFRAKLAQIVALAEAGDITGLQAFEINPVSSSPKAMARYRDLCVIAITARTAVAA